MNTDRSPPSRQVWAELLKGGAVIGTASGNCVTETGEIECDDGTARTLTGPESVFLDSIMNLFEGQP